MNLELLRAGLMMTVIGMGLVFLALALLWGLLAALTRLFPARPSVETAGQTPAPPVITGEMADDMPVSADNAPALNAPALVVEAITAAVSVGAEAGEAAAETAAAPMPDRAETGGTPTPAALLTAERGRVAALVAAALASNALPLLLDAPIGPAFEYGRTNPAWVTANRARTLQRWQPPRRPSNAE